MGYRQKSPLPIINGGTNTETLTNINGTIIFDGTSLATVTPGTAGWLLTSNGASAPTFQAAPAGGIVTLDGDTGSATGSTVTIAGGSNITTSAAASTLTVDLNNTVSVSGSMTAGTGLVATTGGLTVSAGTITTPFTTTGSLVSDTSGVITNTNASTTGFVLTSNGAATVPTFQAAGGGGITWIDQASSPVTLAINTAYSMNLGTLITGTLPVTAAFGTIIQVSGYGTGLWRVSQNASQIIRFGAVSTTTGVGGSLSSTARFDQITMVCAVANTEWVVNSSLGQITYV